MVKIGINGFGRIGRLTLRTIKKYHADNLEVTAVNDLTDAATNAHLFKYDSTYGTYPGEVKAVEGGMSIDGKLIRVFAEKDPARLPWREAGADIVIESTGLFTDAAKAGGHFLGGARRIIISAPAKGEDITIVMGVNEDKYDPLKHKIISNASCTTNCIAPVVKVLNDTFGIQRGFLTTIHAYTNDQRILDQAHKDLRRARTAGQNLIPTTTGAARAVALVLPELKSKLDGVSIRAPVATVSVCDLVADLARNVTVDEVNKTFKAAADGKLKGILQYCEAELVSSDFRGSHFSSILDAPSTMIIGGSMVKVLAWYDNEWGYSCRLGDLADYIAKKGL